MVVVFLSLLSIPFIGSIFSFSFYSQPSASLFNVHGAARSMLRFPFDCDIYSLTSMFQRTFLVSYSKKIDELIKCQSKKNG